PTYLFVRGDENHPDTSRRLRPGTPDVLGGRIEITPVSLPRDAFCPDKRDYVIQETLAVSAAEVTRARNMVAALAQLVPFKFDESARLACLRVEARHTALTAVLQAERLEDAGKKGCTEWTKWATEAAARQRELAVLEARHALAVAAPAARP